MNDAARAARNAYKRAWNKANPEKVKAQQERYWEKRATEMQQAPNEATNQGNHTRADGGEEK